MKILLIAGLAALTPDGKGPRLARTHTVNDTDYTFTRTKRDEPYSCEVTNEVDIEQFLHPRNSNLFALPPGEALFTRAGYGAAPTAADIDAEVARRLALSRAADDQFIEVELQRRLADARAKDAQALADRQQAEAEAEAQAAAEARADAERAAAAAAAANKPAEPKADKPAGKK
jgi:hypothetical protein